VLIGVLWVVAKFTSWLFPQHTPWIVNVIEQASGIEALVVFIVMLIISFYATLLREGKAIQ